MVIRVWAWLVIGGSERELGDDEGSREPSRERKGEGERERG